MSMHKIPLTPLEEEGLRLHGLPVGTPSQTSDTFRQGVAWALQSSPQASAVQLVDGSDDYYDYLGALVEQHPAGVMRRNTDDKAPAVPAEWREVMAELAADVQAACDAEHPHRDQYPSVMRKYNNDMEIVDKARALLQSAEVKAGDKWQLTPAPTHPADRDAREVRHD